MSRKVLQIGYEPERDRLTWDGWDIHCGQGMDVLLPDRLDGGTWRAVSFEYNDEGWYMPGHPDVSPAGQNDDAVIFNGINKSVRIINTFTHAFDLPQ